VSRRIVSMTDHFFMRALAGGSPAWPRSLSGPGADQLAEMLRRSRPAPVRLSKEPAARPSWSLPARPPNPTPSWSLRMEPAAEHVDLRLSAKPTATVRLGQRRRDELFSFARDTAYDDLETAGFLFGSRAWSWKPISVTRVTHWAKKRCENSCAFDLEELVAEKGRLRASGVHESDFGEIGCWHTHPSADDGTPSPTDLNTWLNARDFLDVSRYLCLILTAAPHDRYWSHPEIHGWIVRRSNMGTSICEPAQVEVA
jgi:JAB domain-containing protein similar to deubiquitination enzymes